MDLTELRELRKKGHWEATSKLFEQMLRKDVYDAHCIGEEVSHLVHYTSLDALISMLGVNALDGEAYVLADTKTQAARRPRAARGEDAEEEENGAWRRGYLRLYDTLSANDPNEGTFFVRSADPNGSFQRKYAAVWRLFEDRSTSPAYQTSLRRVSKAEDADNLVFWRTYGRDGTGCALVFPAERLAGLDKLYTVRYGVKDAKDCLGRIEAALDAYDKLGIPGGPDFAGSGSSARLPSSIENVLSPLVHLYKSEHYEYEKEARIVVPFSDLEKGALLQKGAGGWRHFAQLPELKIEKLLESPSEIVYGPSVEVSPNLEFVLRELIRQRGVYARVRPSGISYRS